MTNRRHLLQGIAAASALFSLPPAALAAPRRAAAGPWAQAAAILARIKAPSFAARDFDITAFGAVADGKTLNSEAIAKAIAACNEAGGGRVVVPAGLWLSGAIHLKSNVNLHLAKGATVLFSTDSKDYPRVFTRWEGVECMNHSPLVYAFEQENIAITGQGTFDGQGGKTHWWPWKGLKENGWLPGTPNQIRARIALFKMGEDGVPVEQRIMGEGSYLRPNFVEPYRCKNVLIEGVTFKRSPFWVMHPTLCENVTVRGVTVDTAGPNTDGCDPESCKDVLIENCNFNNGDDCIAVKSGRNNDGRRVNVPTENLIIRNCRMKNGHGGIALGSEITGGVRNVFAENCRLSSPDLWSAIRLKNNARRGGVLENFHFRNIVVGQVAHAVLQIDENYEEGAKGGYKPVVRNIHLENVVAGDAPYGIDVQGLPGSPIEDVTLTNCVFQHVSEGNIIDNTNGLVLKNVKSNGKPLTLPL
jgi:polygalacturonase